MLFGCAAKPRGEKLFGFSPSYSHYCRFFDSFSRRTPKGVRRLILSPRRWSLCLFPSPFCLPPSVEPETGNRADAACVSPPRAAPGKDFLRFLKKQLTSVFFFDKIAKPWPSGSVG